MRWQDLLTCWKWDRETGRDANRFSTVWHKPWWAQRLRGDGKCCRSKSDAGDCILFQCWMFKPLRGWWGPAWMCWNVTLATTRNSCPRFLANRSAWKTCGEWGHTHEGHVAGQMLQPQPAFVLLSSIWMLASSSITLIWLVTFCIHPLSSPAFAHLETRVL